jgi:RNA polymerase sigma-70 factor, ECF subfamily
LLRLDECGCKARFEGGSVKESATNTAASSALLSELHRVHADALWRYALRLTNGDRARAEDVVQETMLRAWRHPDVLQRNADSSRAWLFTVAKRIVIDEWRSARARTELVTDRMPEVSTPDGTDRALQGWLVTDALRQLSVDHRQVLIECYYRGRSVAEAATSLGIAPGTVKSRCHYALRALAMALQERGVTQ